MSLNLEMFTEKQVYVMYSLYKSMEVDLESKQNRNGEENARLEMVKTNLSLIEIYAIQKRQEEVRWSLTSLFQSAGMNPTLILEFYPGSESYNTYGKNLVVNVEYSEKDLKHIFESIRDKSPRVTGQLKFKIVPEFIDGEINTGDIFGIQG
ncbi:hypothetical protein AAEO56_02800 [Flavobacterium sp. DGU11]|uniref:Uncharacterized protein n=1 Tax=Flavobacterium arundinis TaxID=3139143 RepID=A0ABU9HSV6_9FLAO